TVAYVHLVGDHRIPAPRATRQRIPQVRHALRPGHHVAAVYRGQHGALAVRAFEENRLGFGWHYAVTSMPSYSPEGRAPTLMQAALDRSSRKWIARPAS